MGLLEQLLTQLLLEPMRVIKQKMLSQSVLPMFFQQPKYWRLLHAL